MEKNPVNDYVYLHEDDVFEIYEYLLKNSPFVRHTTLIDYDAQQRKPKPEIFVQRPNKREKKN